MRLRLKPLEECVSNDYVIISRGMERFFGKEVELNYNDSTDTYYKYLLYDDERNCNWGIAEKWIDNSYKIEYDDINKLFEEIL
jgi:hypothetical protein